MQVPHPTSATSSINSLPVQRKLADTVLGPVSKSSHLSGDSAWRDHIGLSMLITCETLFGVSSWN
jgi:hypothetical protein